MTNKTSKRILSTGTAARAVVAVAVGLSGLALGTSLASAETPLPDPFGGPVVNPVPSPFPTPDPLPNPFPLPDPLPIPDPEVPDEGCDPREEVCDYGGPVDLDPSNPILNPPRCLLESIKGEPCTPDDGDSDEPTVPEDTEVPEDSGEPTVPQDTEVPDVPETGDTPVVEVDPKTPSIDEPIPASPNFTG